ncbi:MAG: NADH-quinone oxidoreductase subunit L, partial [Candidatus Bathyarchaeota archaeon]
VTTLCCYELIRHDGTELAEENAQRALWMGLVGGVALIAAVYVGHFSVGSIAFDELLKVKPTPLLLMGFAFLALASFTKSAQFPFHSWLLGAMVAPTPVSALVHSSTMVNAGVYLILRMTPAIEGTPLSWAIALIGAFTFMLTAILAVNQRVSKGILAYSTIGNLGLIILCAGINTPLSIAAALTLLLFHSLSKGLLFMGAGIVENRLHSRLVEDWEGLLRRLPFTTTIMVAGMASMFLPPFGMLLGKWAAMDAVASSPQMLGTILIVLMVVGSAATTLFWAKWLGHLTTLPMRKINFALEQLQAPYQFSLTVLLGLDVLIAVGAAYLIKNIVLPVMSAGQRPSIVTPSLNVNTGFGTFLVLPLWTAFVLTLLLGMYVARRKGGTVRTPYIGGENIGNDPVSFRTTADTEAEFKVAGMFLGDIISEGNMSKYGVIAGVALILLMFVTVVI